jgi:integrase
MEELAPAEPEAFKALILSLICGLRRSEADAMQWAQVDLEAGTLEIMDTEHRALKSADSAGKIGLDAEVVAILRGFKAKTKSPFILETPKLARAAFKEHKSRTYRCDATHTALIEWLRKHGVTGKRPLHTMRKEIGSIIATREGIFAASRFLRHSDIRITSRLYADTKTLVSSGLGALLAPAKKTVINVDFQPQADDGAKPKRKAKSSLPTRHRTAH